MTIMYFIMEIDGSNVIKMSLYCPNTLLRLIVPAFNLVIVTTRDEQRLRFVKINASYRSFYTAIRKIWTNTNQPSCSSNFAINVLIL